MVYITKSEVKRNILVKSEGGNNIPIGPHFKKVLKSMRKQYGTKRGTRVFYASANKYKWDYSK
jgi:hypothetical protein